jgi:hypothetical protein
VKTTPDVQPVSAGKFGSTRKPLPVLMSSWSGAKSLAGSVQAGLFISGG